MKTYQLAVYLDDWHRYLIKDPKGNLILHTPEQITELLKRNKERISKISIFEPNEYYPKETGKFVARFTINGDMLIDNSL